MEKIYCQKCKKSLCPEHAYSYVDGNNISITNSSPTLCKKCYEEKYNKKILTDVELFKVHFIETLNNLKYNQKINVIQIENLIDYINNTQ